MNQFLYPETVSFECRPAPKGLLRFRYREDFGKEHVEIVARTLEAMSAELRANPGMLNGARVRGGKTWIEISGISTRETIGDMMVGEFMPWSSTANVPLRRIFETAISGILLQARQVEAPSVDAVSE